MSRFGSRIPAVAALLAALLAPAGLLGRAQAQVPAAKKQIVVGEGVGGVKLGMTAEQVVAVTGQPVQTNRDGDRVVYMSFSEKDIFGVYFDGSPARVHMLIVAAPGHCTLRNVCLARAGEIARLKAAYGSRVVRFKERDGEILYRILNRYSGKRSVLTSFSEGTDNALSQVTILHWDGAITDSTLDGDAPAPKGKATDRGRR